MHVLTRHWIFWLTFVALIFGFAWMAGWVLSPFLAGMIIAYALNPMVKRLTALRIPRWAASLMALAIFIAAVLSIFLLLWPIIITQAEGLLDTLPLYYEKFMSERLPALENYFANFLQNGNHLGLSAGDVTGAAANWFRELASELLSGGIAIIEWLALLLIAPFVAFYISRDWEHLMRLMNGLLPNAYADAIRAEVKQVDATISGFIRGQTAVCLTLSFIYAIGLSVIGVRYGLLIGLLAGILSFIPYLGLAVGLLTSALVAYSQFDNYTAVLTVFAVFAVGHIAESYFLTPKLVGKRVGLHPLWIIFALMLGGKLFGFMGLLLAVPVAAIIGVLVRFAVKQYKTSSYYTIAK